MKKIHVNNSTRINIGAPSIILLITVLGLSVFAILSIRAAHNGLRLAKSSSEALARYYEADTAVTKTVFQIREKVVSCKNNKVENSRLTEELSTIENVVEVSSEMIIIEVPVNDSSYIHVKLLAKDGDFENLSIAEHRTIVEAMDGYNGDPFKIFETELED